MKDRLAALHSCPRCGLQNIYTEHWDGVWCSCCKTVWWIPLTILLDYSSIGPYGYLELTKRFNPMLGGERPVSSPLTAKPEPVQRGPPMAATVWWTSVGGSGKHAAAHASGGRDPLNDLALRMGKVLLNAGTASAPSLSFFDDQDCGLYRIGANSLGLSINGANVISFTTTGVGIGTVVPLGPGHIKGAAALTTDTTTDMLVLERPYNSGVSFGKLASIRLGGSGSDDYGRLDFCINPAYSAIEANPASLPALTTVMTLLGNGNVLVAGGLHVGGTSDPGDNQLQVDGLAGAGNRPVYADANGKLYC